LILMYSGGWLREVSQFGPESKSFAAITGRSVLNTALLADFFVLVVQERRGLVPDGPWAALARCS